jgi:hypothetical protein
MNIKKDFLKRNSWKNYRASAVFPCYINDKNDQILVYQNYWKLKNNIKKIVFKITVFDIDAKKKITKNISVNNHNSISIKKIFNLKEFEGMIECEVSSIQNLKFPFPALTMFYSNNNKYLSAVHSAGRYLNKNEINNSKLNFFEESNFFVKFEKNFIPFLHLFAGKKIIKNKNFCIYSIYDEKNNLIKKIEKRNLFKKPYQSKFLYIDKNKFNYNPKKKYYIRVKFGLSGAFGRLVVGNYNNELDAFFITHSFKVLDTTNSDDYTIPIKNYDATVVLPVINKYPMSVTAISYPTNIEDNFILKLRSITSQNKKLLNKNKKYPIFTGGNSGKIFSYTTNKNLFSVLYSNKKTPSRINVSYNYSIKNSIHPTDIATGFKTYHYPKKFNHWGHGCSRKNFVNLIIMRNISHKFEQTKKAKCKIEYFINNKKKNKSFIVQPETYKILELKNLNKIFKDDFFSWTLNSSEPTLETFWISYNEHTGAICGDHGF